MKFIQIKMRLSQDVLYVGFKVIFTDIRYIGHFGLPSYATDTLSVTKIELRTFQLQDYSN